MKTAAALLALGLLIPSVAAAEARDPIQAAVTEVTAILHDEAMPEPEKREKVVAIVDEVLDISVMSRLVMARNWTKLSAEQKETFQKEFKATIVNTYWKNASRGEFEEIVITSDREEKGGDWTVKSEVVLGGDKQPILIDYRMRKSDGGDWLAIDVIIEGVSLVSNYRSQYKSVFSNGGADHLLELMQEKNAKGETADVGEG